jgi:hypothetical protein
MCLFAHIEFARPAGARDEKPATRCTATFLLFAFADSGAPL